MDRQLLRRWWPLAAVVALLAAAVLAAAHSAPQLDRIPRAGSSEDPPELTEPETPSPPAEPPAVSAEGIQLPGWLPGLFGALLVALVAAVVLAIGWFLVRDLLRRRDDAPDGGEQPGGRADGEEVIAAVDAGLADLSDTDRDPRRAVIACWLRLEEAAGAAGLPRQVGDTSTDLVSRLLRGDPATADGGEPAGVVVSADVLAGFAEVYRAARYATHDVDEAMRAQALTALRRLRAELTGQAVR
jgi:hypothetical protein